jgi:hypothetical protein
LLVLLFETALGPLGLRRTPQNAPGAEVRERPFHALR